MHITLNVKSVEERNDYLHNVVLSIMTGLKKIVESVKNSKVKLTKGFWDKQNEKIRENQKRFAEEDRSMRMTPKELARKFDV